MNFWRIKSRCTCQRYFISPNSTQGEIWIIPPPTVCYLGSNDRRRLIRAELSAISCTWRFSCCINYKSLHKVMNTQRGTSVLRKEHKCYLRPKSNRLTTDNSLRYKLPRQKEWFSCHNMHGQSCSNLCLRLLTLQNAMVWFKSDQAHNPCKPYHEINNQLPRICQLYTENNCG